MTVPLISLDLLVPLISFVPLISPKLLSFRELARLGTSLRLAISIGLSRKGPYRLAKTLATPVGDDQPMAQGSGFVVCQRTVGEYPLPRYGAVAHGNRLVRTRMPGGVGRGREILPLTRLDLAFFICRPKQKPTSFRKYWIHQRTRLGFA